MSFVVCMAVGLLMYQAMISDCQLVVAFVQCSNNKLTKVSFGYTCFLFLNAENCSNSYI